MITLDELLNTLEDLRKTKDVDKIGELFTTLISMYGVTVDEVCAITYYLIDTTLNAPHNKVFLADRLGIDIDKLGIDAKFDIAKAMVAVYVDKVRNNET